MSKREQAAQEFVWQVNSRTRAALVDYFVSHGVWVEDDDLETAFKLDAHRSFLNTLSKDLEITAKATRLASDIGSISLAEKEKAMKSVYEVEERCKEAAADRGALSTQAAYLHRLVNAWPAMPALGVAFALGILGCFLIFVNLFAAGGLAVLFAAGYGLFKVMSFERLKKTLAVQAANANAEFEALVLLEVTPRPEIPDGKDRTRLKAYAYSGILFLAAIASLALHPRSSQSQPELVQASSSTPPMVSKVAEASAPEQKSEPLQGRFAWLVGKYPSDVVNDKRFRAAFNHVTPSDWRKISERFAVTNGDIQSKDGFLFAEGCMSHLCASDRAAFVISETTGKGDIVYHDSGTGDEEVGTTRKFVWREMPLPETPLAEWTRMSGQSRSSATASVGTAAPLSVYRPSFDCTKARSDAERLVCGDAELAAEDVQLAEVYARAKAAVTDQTTFRERTRAQWNYREQNCHDRVCLQRWYVDQKVALAQIAQTGRVDDQ